MLVSAEEKVGKDWCPGDGARVNLGCFVNVGTIILNREQIQGFGAAFF